MTDRTELDRAIEAGTKAVCGNTDKVIIAALIAAAPALAAALLAERKAREVEVGELRAALQKIKRVAEMSAEIMRDQNRTGRWEGSERTARAFQRLSNDAEQALKGQRDGA